MGRLLRGSRGAKVGRERQQLGFTVHSGRPQQTFVRASDLGQNLDLDWGVGLRLGGVGLGWRFSLLLLLQEDLVVQKLELGWVPAKQK